MTRITEERGFTLVEVLVATVIGIVVLLACNALLDSSVTLTGQTQDRVDSTARARPALEQMARELRSQVCPSAGSAAITYADANSVTFYSFVGSGTFTPQQVKLSYSSTSQSVIESDYVNGSTWPTLNFPSTPTRTNTLLQNVVPESGTPIFSYFTFPSSGSVSATQQLTSTPLSASDLQSVARISIHFVARANNRSDNQQSTDMQSDVYIPTWNPNGASGPLPPPCL